MCNKDYVEIYNAVETLVKKDLDKLMGEQSLDFKKMLKKLVDNSYLYALDSWISYYSLYLEKWTIDTMKFIATTKTGDFSVPSSTGLTSFFVNLLSLYNCTNKINNIINLQHIDIFDNIGYIPEKGRIKVQTSIFLNPYEDTGITYKQSGLKANDLKKIYTIIKTIESNAFCKDVTDSINNLTQDYDGLFTSLKDFLGIKTRVVNEEPDGSHVSFTPSSGQQSLLLLSNSLVDNDKIVYLLDEPELSIGHNYINDVIVPRLRELSKLDKVVIVSTHDANIAVRSYPLLSVYREVKKTFVGNMFTDTLVFGDEVINWTETSLKYLEGGEQAFEERTLVYGKEDN